MAAETDKSAIADGLKLAMRRLPGPVALVTTCEPDGSGPAGLVASALIPVSMDPPSMLVAINQSSTTHQVISRSQRFCISLLGTGQTAFVGLFTDGTLRDKRFDSDEWEYRGGLPYLTTACSNIFCTVGRTLIFGTHELFVGEVEDVRGECPEGQNPLGWMEGDFASLGRLD